MVGEMGSKAACCLLDDKAADWSALRGSLLRHRSVIEVRLKEQSLVFSLSVDTLGGVTIEVRQELKLKPITPAQPLMHLPATPVGKS